MGFEDLWHSSLINMTGYSIDQIEECSLLLFEEFMNSSDMANNLERKLRSLQ
jgi:hypothetical protein